MKKSVLISLAFALIASIISGCASTRGPVSLTPEITKKTVKDMPDWFVSPPNDKDFIFGTGTAISRDVSIARQRAEINARRNIASNLQIYLEGITKSFEEEIGQSQESEILQQFSAATKEVVKQTLYGTRVKEAKIVPEGDVVRFYVLMEMPVGSANKALTARISQNEQLYTLYRSSKLFEELNQATTGTTDTR